MVEEIFKLTPVGNAAFQRIVKFNVNVFTVTLVVAR